jgi:putative transposase
MKKSTRKIRIDSRDNDRKLILDQELLGLRDLFPLPGQKRSELIQRGDYDEIMAFVERVISLNGIAVRVQKDLFKTIMRTGIDVIQLMLEDDRRRIVGKRYKHQEDRKACRHGFTGGRVVFGGRKMSIQKPRIRAEGQEVELPTYKVIAMEDPLNDRILEQILLGVATRKYKKSLEDMGEGIRTGSVSKSAVSRRFVALTMARLQQKLGQAIEGEIVVLALDGIEIAGRMIVVALGVTAEGEKKVLGLREGSTENAAVCRALLQDLIQRGLPADKRILVIIDGGKGLNKAVREVFCAYAIVQRCQVHKKRNVTEHLPFHRRQFVKKIMNQAYNGDDFEKSRRTLLRLADNLENEYPSAAASLREGLDETLTVIRLGLPEALRMSFSSSNMIESMLSMIRYVQRNVRRWRNGRMILRWTCIGALEAEKKFRRVKGYRHMAILINALVSYNEVADVA